MKEDQVFIPNNIKVLFTIINRVGFPIVAFLLMFYVCYTSLAKMTDSLNFLGQEVQGLKRDIHELDVPRKR